MGMDGRAANKGFDLYVNVIVRGAANSRWRSRRGI